MSDSQANCKEVEVPGIKSPWLQRGSLAVVCLLVLGVYAYMVQPGPLELLAPSAADTYYNLLVRGFRAGQLSLRKEVPLSLVQLPDPYDPNANSIYWAEPYRMIDLSYYKGRLYLYFGITPALVLFWPYVALTGRYLFHWQAVITFCMIGFLASVGLLCVLWQRYFVDVSVGVVMACALALGLATGVPVLLSQSDVYEVPISCAYMLTMLALGAIWCALHEPERSRGWLVLASLAYGLAVGARPNLLLGAIILLVPAIQAWQQRRPIVALSLAGAVPITVIGLGLMLYNALRFNNPLEFGTHYMLAGERQVTRQFFSLHYLWFNFRVFFLEPARWGSRFPFVHGIVIPPLPAGDTQVKNPFGILTSIPLVWLALAVPLAWRNRPQLADLALRWFVGATTLMFGICALTLSLVCGANFRYEVDFLPALVLLAVIGILGLERVLVDRPAWRRASRWAWGLLLAFSVAFNLLASVDSYAETYNYWGISLARSGRAQEAIQRLELALRLKPDYAEAHYNLGVVLGQSGRVQEAIGHFEQALRANPDDPETNYQLGIALGQAGRLPEAAGYMERALRTRPDDAEAQYNLGVILVRLGRVQEAMAHWEKALRIKPDYAQAHYNMGVGLERAGKLQEAIQHYEQAVRIKPDYPEAQNRLARLRAVR